MRTIRRDGRRRRPGWRGALLTASVLVAALSPVVSPGLARANDGSPCGARSTRTVGTTITTQYCPIYVPARLGYVPVVSFSPAGVVGRILHGGSVNWFLCQARGARAGEGADHNVWWALTLSDDLHRGWVSEVYFHGGGQDEPDGGLRACGSADVAWGGAGSPGAAPAPQPSPTPGPTPTPAAKAVVVYQPTLSYSTPYLDAANRRAIATGTYTAICEASSQKAGPYRNPWWTKLANGRWINNSYLHGDVKMNVGDCPAPADDRPRAAPACQTYQILGLRGSGESYGGTYDMGSTVGPTAARAVSLLPAHSVRAYSIPYPATGVDVLLTNPSAFFDSMYYGQSMLIDEVRRVLARCPSSKIGIIGYSQGAGAASEALRHMSSWQLAHVRVVILFADPYSFGETPTAVTLEDPPGDRRVHRWGVGALGARKVPIAPTRLFDICFLNDIVCDVGDTGTILYDAATTAVHSDYKSWWAGVLPTIMGRAVAQKLKA
jgi:Cutinase